MLELIVISTLNGVLFGMLLFTMKSVAPKEIAMSQVWHAVTPYVVMGMVALALVIVFPPLATWLPKALIK